MSARAKKQEPEAKVSGIRIETKTLTTIKTTDGMPVKKGDTILLKVRDETVLCSFVGLSGGGYFVTTPFDESGAEVKYRLGSIAACFKVEAVTFAKEKQASAESAAEEPADAQTLAEA